ncbi:MAG TPA: GNAT family N-acetyltransferase [Pyrinomonadaceae bacterium]|nr:GNAT family N-acetyltransferase [Pyrinomonadaceae bacterium]
MARIREYRPEDASQVERCFIVLQEHERTVEPRRATGEAVCEKYLEYMHRRAVETGGRVFVAEADGQIVGFSCVWAHVPEDELINAPGEFAYVSDLVVLPPFRGRRLGYELLRACEEYAVAEGARSLKIGVLARNWGARQLYERFGFEESTVEMTKNLEAK